MPGVMLHAHATSQLLSAALDGRGGLWDLPEVVEVLWIILGATGGAYCGHQVTRCWWLGLLGGGVVLVGVPLGVLAAGGWMPMVPAGVAFGGSAIATALLRNRALPTAPKLEPTQPPMAKP